MCCAEKDPEAQIGSKGGRGFFQTSCLSAGLYLYLILKFFSCTREKNLDPTTPCQDAISGYLGPSPGSTSGYNFPLMHTLRCGR